MVLFYMYIFIKIKLSKKVLIYFRQSYFQDDSFDEDKINAKKTTISKQTFINEFLSPSTTGDIPVSQEVLDTEFWAKHFKAFTFLGDKCCLHARLSVSSEQSLKIDNFFLPKDVKTNISTNLIDNISYWSSEKDLNFSETDISVISMLTDETYNKRKWSKPELMKCSNVEDSPNIGNHQRTTNESVMTSQTVNEECFDDSNSTKSGQALNSSNVMEISLNEDNHSAGSMWYSLVNEPNWQQSVPDLVKEIVESMSVLNVSPINNILSTDLTVLMENCSLEDINVVEYSSIVKEKSTHSLGHFVLNENNPNPIPKVQEKSEIRLENKVDNIKVCKTHNLQIETINSFDRESFSNDCKMIVLEEVSSPNVLTDKLNTLELTIKKKSENTKLDASSSTLDKTIEQIENLKLSPLAESEEMKSFTSSMIEQSVEFGENELSESQQVSKPDIVDFSIIEQLMEPSSTLSESKLANSSLNDNKETVINIKEKESVVSHDSEMLAGIKVDDMSLIMDSLKKSSMSESFYSIESDNVTEDNKRKIEPVQEYKNVEKKMKVEEPKTPTSKLFKIKNMFKSSEKPKCNFSSGKENTPFSKPTSLRKPEVNVKSKIPCKVLVKSMTKSIDFNLSDC
ncbi:uncharacterized protein LOC126842771 [Adelges cooleyi]|uniref:uncharacterized protein LOC126842771 n=1 Tax=Adelges cooleyi TaxID=133065 RepID=UPI00217F4209|nr:uncharacterized protein LOC126842771 [Adelges cooleyi]